MILSLGESLIKVKIGDEIFDSKDQPIMLILSENDKRKIKSVPYGYGQCCFFNSLVHDRVITEFMQSKGEN